MDHNYIGHTVWTITVWSSILTVLVRLLDDPQAITILGHNYMAIWTITLRTVMIRRP